MADTGVNNQMVEAIRLTREAVGGPGAAWEHGCGKAFQFVAQSTAMAIQDATDNLRNVGTISTTAIGVAMAQMMSSGDVQTWGSVIAAAQSLVKTGAADFQRIGETAALIMRTYPRGETPAGESGSGANSSSQRP